MAQWKHGSARIQQRPDGAVRQSQLVITFGPGSMVDLLDHAVLVGGLDFWSYDRNYRAPYVDEPRLRDAIVSRAGKSAASGDGRQHPLERLSRERPFRGPPTGNDREPSKFAGVQVLEFPQWFVCQAPKCRRLAWAREFFEHKNRRWWHTCDNRTKSECVPVRFVVACKRGHVDEFPWVAYVHEYQKRPRCATPSLTFDEGPTGDFNDIQVHCACGASGRLSNVLGGLKMNCHGARPWLGPDAREPCGEQARLLVRTASNSYFPQVMSALSILDRSGDVVARVRDVWDVLQDATREDLPTLRRIVPKVKAALEGLDDDTVMAAINALRENKAAEQKPLRTAEFEQLSTAPPEVPGDLPTEKDPIFARRAKVRDGLPPGVSKLVVVPKLREVVALIGFTRLEPITPDVQGEYDLDVQMAALGLTTDWLPATELRGEGIFLELDEKAVGEWERREAVKARARELEAGYEAWRKTLDSPDEAPPFPGVRFYMLHSLSHLLMSAISLECGYAASALRERIYCGPSGEKYPDPMAAILLSTGTSGTEGTLGGLVEQGRRVRAHLRDAYDLGRLCSNDPVCATHSPEGDHAERYLEGAACHGCLFVAECSCERFNRYLDRALVVPSIGHPPEIAFFAQRP
jgi:hypothetical protein